ncbi:hypothetical protein GCM10009738_88010 [Kitasatospora viridis]
MSRTSGISHNPTPGALPRSRPVAGPPPQGGACGPREPLPGQLSDRATPARVTGPHWHPARRSLTGPQPQTPDRNQKRIRQHFPASSQPYHTGLRIGARRKQPTSRQPSTPALSGGTHSWNTNSLPLSFRRQPNPFEAQRTEI